MARKSKTVSVYERIAETEQKIQETEDILKQLNEELRVLMAEKDDLEMRQTWAAIKEQGLTMEQIQKKLLDTK